MAKIMMIDDEPETLDIYTCYLVEEHTLYPYHTGEEALREILTVKPDIILLDIEMPYMDGFKVLEFIRSSKELSQIPVIGVTGQRSKATALKFLAKGAAAYILKPVNKDSLRLKIREVYEKEIARRNKRKVLIVDDEIESLLYYKTLLSDYYNVMALSSGKAALEYLLVDVPDIIILDYQMPLFNGKQLFQIIRTMDKMKSVPICFLSGTNDKDVILECAEIGSSGFITKGADISVVLGRIEEILNNQEA